MLTEYEDPYDRDEDVFRTDGRDVCHWCASRPQEWIWGSYKTRICGCCQQLIEAGRAHDIVEEVAAPITVRMGWDTLNEESWRRREHDVMEGWLSARSTCEPVESTPGPDEGEAAGR